MQMRKIDGYEILLRLSIGKKEFCIGQDQEERKPYVSWWCETDENGKPNFRGRFFSSRLDAVEDWCRRVSYEAERQKKRGNGYE